MNYIKLSLFVAVSMVFAGCQRSFMSLALPTPVPVPYVYSQSDYNADLAVYQANAPFLADPIKQQLAQSARNSIAFGLMGLIDDVYNKYSAQLFTRQGEVRIAGDSAALGVTAAVTVARDVATKTLLGALGTAITGANLSVDKNLFAQQTYQMIALAMETRRAEVFSDCWNGLNNLTVSQYPLSSVKRELILYFYAGSLPGALQELQKETANTSAAVQNAKPKPIYNLKSQQH